MLQGKIAIITGGSRGIGKAIARTFVENGAKVLLVATNVERLTAATAEMRSLGGTADFLAGDIAEPEFSQRIAAKALADHGAIDILVNCAGIISRTPFEQLGLTEWHRVLDVNLHGAFHLCHAVLPHMRQQGRGKVIIMTSQMAKLPHPSAAPSYEVSKAGLQALIRHFAFHYAQHGVYVNGIAPGSIDTDMPKSMTPEARERLKNAIPLRRLGLPAEVGQCALFLASHMSDYITGETIDVNGGTLMD